MALDAVADINSIFERMEVPLVVVETKDLGKHVKATKDLNCGTDLFEERPMVSWAFVETNAEEQLSHCNHCLRVLTDSNSSAAVQCEDCRAWFCTTDCQKAANNLHAIMCGLEGPLQDFQRSVQVKAETAEAMPITVEAVARCVGSMCIRFLTLKAGNPDVPSRELFGAATRNMNRFIEPPRGSTFDDVDLDAWCTCIRSTMTERLMAMCEDSDIVGAFLSSETLNTIVGQLTLNATGLNLALPGAKEQNKTEADPAEEKDVEEEDAPKVRASIGGGIFTLQSCFNHSCAPSAEIVCGADHEITIRLKEDVKAGQEVCISYISPLYLFYESMEQRRKRLEPYFFTCNCPKCAEEAQAAKNTAAAPAQTEGATADAAAPGSLEALAGE